MDANALHSQRGHAEYPHSLAAEFVLTAKQNQLRLYAALDALPWATTPVAAREVDTGHGRITTRTIQVLPAPGDLPFPHGRRAPRSTPLIRGSADHEGQAAARSIRVVSVQVPPRTRSLPLPAGALLLFPWVCRGALRSLRAGLRARQSLPPRRATSSDTYPHARRPPVRHDAAYGTSSTAIARCVRLPRYTTPARSRTPVTIW